MAVARRSPYGERGLKYQWSSLAGEIRAGRSPYGERGLKCHYEQNLGFYRGRSPYGERGLKCLHRGQSNV